MVFLGPRPARRIGRPGLLSSVTRTAVIAGTATMTSEAIGPHPQEPPNEHIAFIDQPQQRTESAPARDAQPDLIDRLSHLARLHASGALTDYEFDAAKARLLA